MTPAPLLAVCSALMDPIAVVDFAGRIVAANPALCELLDYTAGQIQRRDLGLLAPANGRTEQARRLQACLRGEKIVAVASELQTRDARLIPVLQTLSPYRVEDAPEPLVVSSFMKTASQDPAIERLNLILENKVQSNKSALDQTVTALEAEVNERRGVEKELHMSRSQLRMLSQKTLELLESDRQLIAKELHDSIGASLAAIKFSLEGWLEVYGGRLPSPEIPFERIITHIVETIKETKRISANLRPSTLDDLGLLATAKWFCRNLSGLYAGIHITTRFEASEADIPEALKIVL